MCESGANPKRLYNPPASQIFFAYLWCKETEAIEEAVFLEANWINLPPT